MDDKSDDRDDGRGEDCWNVGTAQGGDVSKNGKSLKSGVSSSEMQDAGMGEDESPPA